MDDFEGEIHLLGVYPLLEIPRQEVDHLVFFAVNLSACIVLPYSLPMKPRMHCSSLPQIRNEGMSASSMY